ncbi:YjbG polysaccharide synthesis-related protein [Vibrio campbellii]|nr:YjbG polysaccharide synthesis-related protein [Vibrio sp. LB10LO1]
MRSLLSALSLCVLSSSIYAASPQTTVELTGLQKSLNFDGKVRLVEIMKASQQHGASMDYPLATTLFDESEEAKEYASSLKSFVLNQLMQKNLISHPFYKFIQDNAFSKRVLSDLDLDELRLKKDRNPLISGEYSLITPDRSDRILLLGNLDSVNILKNQQGLPLSDILTNLNDIYDSRNPYPVIIYPDGKVVEPHKGHWKSTYYYLPPLSIVYFPFADFRSSELDKSIVELLTLLKTHP